MSIVEPRPLFCGMYVPSFKRDTSRPREDWLLWDTQEWHDLEQHGQLVSRADVEQAMKDDPHHDIALLGPDLNPVSVLIQEPLCNAFAQDTQVKTALFPVVLTETSVEKYSPIFKSEKNQPILNDDSPFSRYFSLASNTQVTAINDFYPEKLDDLDEALAKAKALAPSS